MNERSLPSAVEAERSVLGAVLLHPDTLYEISDQLTPDDFFRDAHKRIYRVMLAMSVPSIDFVTLKDALARSGELDEIGGPAYVAALADGVPRSTNVGYYAGIIREKAIQRGIITAGTKALTDAYAAQDDASAVIDRTFADLLTLSQRSTGVGLQPTSAFVQRTHDQLEQLSNPESAAWGHRCALHTLDRKLRGFRPGRLIVLAGRPGDGKTSLALNVATAVAKANQPVGVFTLEQGIDEVMLQLVSSDARVNIEDLADGKLDQSDYRRVSEAYETFNSAPLYLDPTTDLSPVSLRAKARRLQIEKGLGLIVVDYIQLMQGLPTAKKHENEYERLTVISRSLKLLAKDLNVPILVCSQLNRAPEARNDGRPQLGDLRGSGSLEQDADTVLLIYDPSKAPKKRGLQRKVKGALPPSVEAEVERGVVEIIVAKNRGLSTGSVRLMFRKECTRFENLAL